MLLLLYVFIILISFWGIRYHKYGFWHDYISKEQCNAVKGICIILVFVRHIFPYLLQSGLEIKSIGDRIFYYIDFYIMQLLVVMFLFYSGFGVMESIKNKGDRYIASMPQKRVLTTFLNFDIAVILYLLLALFVGRIMSWQQVVLSFFAWDSVGNSNWYIFVILACYIVVFISFRLITTDNGQYYKQLGLTVSLFAFVYIFLYIYKQEWWYNTLFTFPIGMLFSYKRYALESFFQKNYWQCLLLVISLFAVTYLSSYNLFGLLQTLNACIFAIVVVLFTMKFRIGNSALAWMGANLFPLYIYQRVPMVALSSIANGIFVQLYPWLFILISATVTIVFAYLYKYIQIRL